MDRSPITWNQYCAVHRNQWWEATSQCEWCHDPVCQECEHWVFPVHQRVPVNWGEIGRIRYIVRNFTEFEGIVLTRWISVCVRCHNWWLTLNTDQQLTLLLRIIERLLHRDELQQVAGSDIPCGT